ncbi:MAG: FKBP-type peptidyl-prolyl cis-trans isomerase [Treponema sp.]
MQITKNSLVTLEYTLKDENGEILDSSVEMGPLEYIHGFGMIVPGLETALTGKNVGEELSVTVAPKDAYGEFDENLIFKVERKQFPADVKVEVGMEFETDGPHGRAVRVIKVGDDLVTIDANHPLAGETLHFDIKVVSSRMATDEEIAELFSHSCDCGCGDSDEDSCGCSGCSGCH